MCGLVFRTLKMHYVDQRMLGLEAEEPVVLFYGVSFCYFHARKTLCFLCKYTHLSNSPKTPRRKRRNSGIFFCIAYTSQASGAA